VFLKHFRFFSCDILYAILTYCRVDRRTSFPDKAHSNCFKSVSILNTHTRAQTNRTVQVHFIPGSITVFFNDDGNSK